LSVSTGSATVPPEFPTAFSSGVGCSFVAGVQRAVAQRDIGDVVGFAIVDARGVRAADDVDGMLLGPAIRSRSFRPAYIRSAFDGVGRATASAPRRTELQCEVFGKADEVCAILGGDAHEMVDARRRTPPATAVWRAANWTVATRIECERSSELHAIADFG
jgi:hypothetical protein